MFKARFYNSRQWKFRRKRQKLKEPFCRTCRVEHNRLIPGTEIDHVENWRDSKNPIYSFYYGELQNLCRDCHDIKTQTEMDKRKKRELLKPEFY